MRILLIGLLSSAILCANNIVVDGFAPVVTSKQMSKKQALLDAKLKAVEMEIGVYIQSTTQVENFEIKYDFIEEHLDGYVSSYKILEEDSENDIYHIKIKADVKKGKINKDIKNLVNMLNYKKRPKFIILSKGDRLITSTFESILKRYLIKNKIDLVNTNVINSEYKTLTATANKIIPYRRFGIDYIIVLNIVRQNLDTNYKGIMHKSINLLITSDVIDTSTFEIIVSTKFPDKLSDNIIIPQSQLSSESQLIADKFSQNLLINIVDKWKDNMYNGENISIYIEGLKSYKEEEQLKDFIKENVADIKSIFTKNYSKGKATYAISIKGGLDKFLDEFIMSNDQYSIEMKNKDSNKCTLILN